MLMAKITLNKYMASTFIDKYYKEYIRDYIFKITEDLEVSEDIANWCEQADESECYTFREGTVTIIDDGE